MTTNKSKVVLISTLSILLFTGVIIGSTFALFTDSKEVESHIEAGTLKIGLSRTKLEGTKVADDGTISTFNDSTKIDLVEDQGSIFNLQKIAPTIYQEATLEIENKGSIAFNYTVDIVDISQDADINLLKQIEVSIMNSTKDEVMKKSLYDFKDDEITSPIADVLASEKDIFYVKASYLDTPDNDLTQGKELSFDIKVYAEQLTLN